MSIRRNSFAVLFLLLVCGSMAIGNGKETGEHSDWYLAKKANGIALYYRWIKLGDGREAREMKATFVVKAEIADIISQFSSSQNYGQWAAGIKACEVVIQNDSLWFTHALMDYPFPFKKKDMITKSALKSFGDHTAIEISAVPACKPECKNVERIKNYWGSWKFFSGKNGVTSVECRVVSGDNPVFPRFVQDPIVQKISIKSFSELKLLAEAE